MDEKGSGSKVAESKHQRWAEVIVDVRVAEVDQAYHYAIPAEWEERLQIGHRVSVPFGHRPRVEGYVVGITDIKPDVARLRAITSVLGNTPDFSAADVDVARWIAHHYRCLLVQALRLFLPPGVSLRRKQPMTERRQKCYELHVSRRIIDEYIEQMARRAPRHIQVLEMLLAAPEGFLPAATLAAPGGYGPLQVLEKRGLIRSISIVQRRRPQDGIAVEKPAHVTLTPDQRRAVQLAVDALEQNCDVNSTLLLHGVTGSGKTEVYMEVIEAAIRRQKGAILLVSDIALTPQTVGRLQRRFGGQIAVLHSNLSIGERYDEWHRIRHGEAPIVIGARSAVFAPVQRLGVVIIDEEHETSYKQDETPRYHAREVAERRLAHNKGVLLLGSATPSLEAYTAVKSGEATYAPLPKRIGNRPLPAVNIVDMREELLAGNRNMFSRVLLSALQEAINNGDQAIVLLNRRGFASFLLCRGCGHVPQCEACGVSLTLHNDPAQLKCHYCGYENQVPPKCPSCSSNYLRPFGVGTQRVEQSLRQLMPEARLARMDRDTTARKGSGQRILSSFARGNIDVLIGTQMIAKGLHFPAVTVVGVISADTALNFPDFRAAERTFQLLTQVAGRAGRGDSSGHVILQTYNPDHYAILAAARHDYAGFAAQEMAYREAAGYPPYTKLVRLIVSGEDEVQVAKTATDGMFLTPEPGAHVIGPAPAPLSRLQGKSRWHTLVKGEAGAVDVTVDRLLSALQPGDAGVHVAVDVDPFSLL